jgi:hypothetical protein
MLALLASSVFPCRVDVDKLACSLHRPTTYNHQTRGQGFLLGAILSHYAMVGGGALLVDTPPPGLDICRGVDCLDACIIGYYIERIFLPGYVCLMLGSLRCVCMYPWLSYHFGQWWDRSQHSSVGSCSKVLSHRVMSAAPPPRDLDAGRAYPVVGAPEWDGQTLGSLPIVVCDNDLE